MNAAQSWFPTTDISFFIFYSPFRRSLANCAVFLCFPAKRKGQLSWEIAANKNLSNDPFIDKM